MASDSRDSRAIEVLLAYRLDSDADAAQIGAALGTLWLEIDTALAPILGQQGVAALFRRSLHLTGMNHPWMVAKQESVLPSADISALKAALLQQSSAEAAAGSQALLLAFHGLLTSLVGPSLTERLLRTVWAPPIRGSPAQDKSP